MKTEVADFSDNPIYIDAIWEYKFQISFNPFWKIISTTAGNPIVVTTEFNHGFSNGDVIGQGAIPLINRNANGFSFTVANKTANTYQLSGVQGLNGTDGGGYAYKTTDNTAGTYILTCELRDTLDNNVILKTFTVNNITPSIFYQGVSLTRAETIALLGKTSVQFICKVTGGEFTDFPLFTGQIEVRRIGYTTT